MPKTLLPANPTATEERLAKLLLFPFRRSALALEQLMSFRFHFNGSTSSDWYCREEFIYQFRNRYIAAQEAGVPDPSEIFITLSTYGNNKEDFLENFCKYEDEDEYDEWGYGDEPVDEDFAHTFWDLLNSEEMEYNLWVLLTAVCLLWFGEAAAKKVAVEREGSSPGKLVVTLPFEVFKHPAVLHFFLSVMRESVSCVCYGRRFSFSEVYGNELYEGNHEAAWEVAEVLLANFRAFDFDIETNHLFLFWSLARWGLPAVIGTRSPLEVWDGIKEPRFRFVTYANTNQGTRWYWGRDHIRNLEPAYRKEVCRIYDTLK